MNFPTKMISASYRKLNFLNGFVVLMMAFAAVTANAQPTPSKVTVTEYHSWTNVISVNNGVVEALVVPDIGRVLQFRFAGDSDGAFYEDPTTFGQLPGGRGYRAFGGDRAWPSPQAEWNWPPPRGFDGSTNTASFDSKTGVVTLVTPVDSRYGIRTTRYIELLSGQPVMRVKTVFERVAESTHTNSLGIWIDCMATTTPESRLYAPVPSPSIFSDGYTTKGSAMFTAALPNGFTNANGLISFAPGTGPNRKLGFDGGTLLLVGTNLALRLDAPRVSGAAYPDGNSSTEVYTAPNYFELEMMGPLTQLPVGSQMEYTTEYRLYRRSEATTDAEAKKILSK